MASEPVLGVWFSAWSLKESNDTHALLKGIYFDLLIIDSFGTVPYVS